MRRTDKEATEFGQIVKILEEGQVCSLGFMDDVYPYIVPLNYGFSIEDEQIYIYFHGALAGRKIDLVQKNPNVAFNILVEPILLRNEKPCKFDVRYQSLSGTGKLELLEDISEKRTCLDHILKQYSKIGSIDNCQLKEKNQDGNYTDMVLNNPEFSDEQISKLAVLKLTVNDFAGKVNLK